MSTKTPSEVFNWVDKMMHHPVAVSQPLSLATLGIGPWAHELSSHVGRDKGYAWAQRLGTLWFRLTYLWHFSMPKMPAKRPTLHPVTWHHLLQISACRFVAIWLYQPSFILERYQVILTNEHLFQIHLSLPSCYASPTSSIQGFAECLTYGSAWDPM